MKANYDEDINGAYDVMTTEESFTQLNERHRKSREIKMEIPNEFKWFTYFCGEVTLYRSKVEFKNKIKTYPCIHRVKDLKPVSDIRILNNYEISLYGSNIVKTVNKVWTVFSTGCMQGENLCHPLPKRKTLISDARLQGELDANAGKAITAFGDWRDDDGEIVDAYMNGYAPIRKSEIDSYVSHQLLLTPHLNVNVHWSISGEQTVHFWFQNLDDDVNPFYAQFVNDKLSMATYSHLDGTPEMNVYFRNGIYDPDLNIYEPVYV